MKKIGIVGVRSRNDLDSKLRLVKKWEKYHNDGDWIVSGGCPRGGDKFANEIAKDVGVPIIIFYPQWLRYGASAGFTRNSLIAEECDMLIAVVAKDRIMAKKKRGGTEDTIRKVKNLGKKVVLVK